MDSILRGSSVKCLDLSPFLDIHGFQSAEQLDFYTDSLGAIGFGCFFAGKWNFGFWNNEFLKHFQPSIEALEMFALCVEIFTWKTELANKRISIYCDNTSVKDAVNDASSRNQMTMVLMRLLIIECLKYNIRLFVEYIRSEKNILADSLSRGNFHKFWENATKGTRKFPEEIPEALWPIEKLWKSNEKWKTFKFKNSFKMF